MPQYSGFAYTIQLNSNYAGFKQTDKIDIIKIICKEKMDAFHVTVNEFCGNVLHAEMNFDQNISKTANG